MCIVGGGDHRTLLPSCEINVLGRIFFQGLQAREFLRLELALDIRMHTNVQKTNKNEFFAYYNGR